MIDLIALSGGLFEQSGECCWFCSEAHVSRVCSARSWPFPNCLIKPSQLLLSHNITLPQTWPDRSIKNEQNKLPCHSHSMPFLKYDISNTIEYNPITVEFKIEIETERDRDLFLGMFSFLFPIRLLSDLTIHLMCLYFSYRQSVVVALAHMIFLHENFLFVQKQKCTSLNCGRFGLSRIHGSL